MQLYRAKIRSIEPVIEAGEIECLPWESPHAVTGRASDEEVTQFAVSHSILVAEALDVLHAVEHVAFRVGEEKQAGLKLPAASSQHLKMAAGYRRLLGGAHLSSRSVYVFLAILRPPRGGNSTDTVDLS